MNEQQYHKQLLVQQIASHRGLLKLELERVKDLNPLQPYIDLGRQVLDVAGLIRSGRGGGGSSAGAKSWLDLGMVIPFVIQLATSLLKRRKKDRD